MIAGPGPPKMSRRILLKGPTRQHLEVKLAGASVTEGIREVNHLDNRLAGAPWLSVAIDGKSQFSSEFPPLLTSMYMNIRTHTHVFQFAPFTYATGLAVEVFICTHSVVRAPVATFDENWLRD